MLTGNKSDLPEKRAIPIEEGQARAKELDVLFIETSAKVGFNIDSLFRKVAAVLPGAEEEQPPQNTVVVNVDLAANPSIPAASGSPQECQC